MARVNAPLHNEPITGEDHSCVERGEGCRNAVLNLDYSENYRSPIHVLRCDDAHGESRAPLTGLVPHRIHSATQVAVQHSPGRATNSVPIPPLRGNAPARAADERPSHSVKRPADQTAV